MPYMISAFSASHIHLTFSAPISVETEPKRRRVNVGDEVTIFCRVRGFPIRQMRWTLNGKVILAENISDQLENETKSKRDLGSGEFLMRLNSSTAV